MAKKKKHTLLKVASAATVTAAAAYSGASYLVFRYAFDACPESTQPSGRKKMGDRTAWHRHAGKGDASGIMGIRPPRLQCSGV